MKVLIAEDDRVMRRQLQSMLEKWGYEVVPAADGNEAWLLLQSPAPPPLLVLDWMMPGMNGVDICRRLRETQPTNLFYIIMVTSRDSLSDIIEGLEAGANDYLTKPFSHAELRTRLRAGERIISLQIDLKNQLTQLQAQREEQRQLQQERDQLLQRLQLQIERMPIGCFLTDEKCHCTYFNPAAEKIFGYTQGELAGSHFCDQIVTPAARPSFQEIFARALGGDMTAHGTCENITKAGRAIICEWHNTPLIDAEGRFYSLLSMVQDITDRIRAEETLRKSAQQIHNQLAELGQVYKYAPVGLFVTDRDLRFLRINERMAALNGMPVEQHIGRTVREIMPDLAGPLGAVFESVLERGEPCLNVELQGRTQADPSVNRHWLANYFPLKNEQSVIVGLIGAVLEITELKRSEAQLRKLSRAVEQSHAAILITTADGHVDYVNPKFSQLTGYMLDEIIGQNPRFQKSGETLPHEYANLWQTISHGGEWRGELHNRKKNGDLWWASASISPVTDSEGNTTNYLAIYEDITGKKHQEEALKQTEEKFRQSQKMEAIGSLAGGVAHDFNNLLSVIIGYADLMAMELKKEDPLRSNVDQIRKAGTRAADLTRQLLAFSRKQVMQPRVLDLNQVIGESSKMLQRLIGEDIELALFLDPALGKVKVDPGQLTQVILNLAINARDAMPTGGKLTIETTNVTLDEAYAETHVYATPGSYVLLSISDTGCGMSEEVLSHIFEPFFTTKDRGKGTGLGLSTVYGIIKQSGGNIEVSSELKNGTTFDIYLPQVEAPVEAAEQQLASNQRVRSETILVVEDDEMVRSLASHMLRKRGYRVLEASNGGEALLICEEHSGPIHLLLTDVIMPHLSGRALAHKLASMRPDMKVLYMSGYTDNIILPHGMMEAKIAFIQKPFTPEELLHKLEHTLDSPT